VLCHTAWRAVPIGAPHRGDGVVAQHGGGGGEAPLILRGGPPQRPDEAKVNTHFYKNWRFFSQKIALSFLKNCVLFQKVDAFLLFSNAN